MTPTFLALVTEISKHYEKKRILEIFASDHMLASLIRVKETTRPLIVLFEVLNLDSLESRLALSTIFPFFVDRFKRS